MIIPVMPAAAAVIPLAVALVGWSRPVAHFSPSARTGGPGRTRRRTRSGAVAAHGAIICPPGRSKSLGGHGQEVGIYVALFVP